MPIPSGSIVPLAACAFLPEDVRAWRVPLGYNEVEATTERVVRASGDDRCRLLLQSRSQRTADHIAHLRSGHRPARAGRSPTVLMDTNRIVRRTLLAASTTQDDRLRLAAWVALTAAASASDVISEVAPIWAAALLLSPGVLDSMWTGVLHADGSSSTTTVLATRPWTPLLEGPGDDLLRLLIAVGRHTQIQGSAGPFNGAVAWSVHTAVAALALGPRMDALTAYRVRAMLTAVEHETNPNPLLPPLVRERMRALLNRTTLTAAAPPPDHDSARTPARRM